MNKLTIVVGFVLFVFCPLIFAEPNIGLTLPGEKSSSGTKSVQSFYEKYRSATITLQTRNIYFTGTAIGWKDGWTYGLTYWNPKKWELGQFVAASKDRSRHFDTRVVWRDRTLIVFRSRGLDKPEAFPTIDFKRSIRVADEMYLIGNAKDSALDHTLVKLSVSGRDRKLWVHPHYWKLLQFQAAIPESFGGAVYDQSGQIVAVAGLQLEEVRGTVFGVSLFGMQSILCGGQYLDASALPSCKDVK